MGKRHVSLLAFLPAAFTPQMDDFCRAKMVYYSYSTRSSLPNICIFTDTSQEQYLCPKHDLWPSEIQGLKVKGDVAKHFSPSACSLGFIEVKLYLNCDCEPSLITHKHTDRMRTVLKGTVYPKMKVSLRSVKRVWS